MSGSTPVRPWSGVSRTALTIAAAIAFIGAVALIGGICGAIVAAYAIRSGG